MKKKAIFVGILTIVGAATALKADTKKRVAKLEVEVVKLSKSERKAWELIEHMNKQLAELERQAAERYRTYADMDEDLLD